MSSNLRAAPVNYDVQWDGAKPYYNLSDGGKRYLSPVEALGLQTAAQADGKPVDPRIAAYLGGASPEGGTSGPAASLFQTAGEWNPETGKFDQGINWSNIASMGIGGAMAAPLVAGALGAGAGGSAIGTGTSGFATAPLASTSILPAGSMVGAAVPGAGLASGIGGAAAATGATAGAAGAAAPLASSSILPAGSMTGAAVPGAGMSSGVGGASVMSRIADAASKPGVGKALSGYAQSAAGNREAANHDNLAMAQELLLRDANSRRNTSTAYRDAMMSNYAQNYQPNVRPAGVPGGNPNPVNPGNQAVSGELYNQALAKLKANAPNYTAPPAPIPAMQTKPGIGENLAGYGSLLLGLYGNMK